MSTNVKVTVIQQRPYTCVTAEAADGTQCICFSKICQPDAWSARMGMQLALGRAMAEMLSVGYKTGGGIAVFAQEVPPQPAEECEEPVKAEEENGDGNTR